MKNNKIYSETEIYSTIIEPSYDIENPQNLAENCTEIVEARNQTAIIPAEPITEMVEVSNQTAMNENEVIVQLRTLINFQKNRIAKLRCINFSLTIIMFCIFIFFYNTVYLRI